MSLILALLGGCSTARIPGPELAKAPRDLELKILPERVPIVFPRRELLDQRGYLREEPGGPLIRLTTYRGAVPYAEVLEAWSEGAEARGTEVGPVEPLEFGLQPAWGWRRIEFEDGSPSIRSYVAVLLDSERDRTYTVEYRVPARDPVTEPKMIAVIGSLTLRRSEVSVAKIGLAVVLAGALALAVAAVRRRI